MAGDYPSKPMSLYATIWDASDWATSGGKYKVNYKYAPFVAEFTDLTLHGCSVDPLEEILTPNCNENDDDATMITPKQRSGMNKFRQKHMYYSYCYDTLRYPVPPPECVIDPMLRERFKETGRLKFGGKQHRNHSKRSRSSSIRSYGNQDDV